MGEKIRLEPTKCLKESMEIELLRLATSTRRRLAAAAAAHRPSAAAVPADGLGRYALFLYVDERFLPRPEAETSATAGGSPCVPSRVTR